MIGLAKLATGPGHLELAQRPVVAPGAGEVVVEVAGAGVCGTDLHIESGEYACLPPVTLGHEVSGVVAAVGPGGTESLLGARVVCEPCFYTCGECAACRGDQPNLCPRRRSIGAQVDGGFAPLLVVPERALHRIPDWLDLRSAALCEPLAVVCQALQGPGLVEAGDRVLIVGPGPIGLLAAQVAAALGGEVSVAGLPSDSARLEVAEKLGFRPLTESEGPESADVAIETSGSAGGLDAAADALRRGGRLVQIGLVGGPVTLDLDRVALKVLSWNGSFGSTPAAWRFAIELLERRRVAFDPLVSEVAPLASWERVFADLRAGRKMKVVLDPGEGGGVDG